MPSSPSSSVTTQERTTMRRARLGVAVLFLTNGAIFANVLPRYPAIKADLGLTNVQFGIAVAGFPLGALVAGLTAGALIRRFRSSRVAVVATLLTAAGIVLTGVAPTWAALFAGLFLAGAMDAITDVAQNSHGLRVQRLYRRSILNSFHAVWSIGAVLGGLMGAAAAGLEIPRGPHLVGSAVLFSALAVLGYRFLLPGPEPSEPDEATAHDPAAHDSAGHDPAAHDAAARGTAAPTAARAGRLRVYAILLALVVIAASGAVVEDAGASWAALYLSGPLGASAFVAGFGFIALQGMQFVGRLLGDRLVDRFGQRTVARTGGLVVALGMGTALLVPTVPGTIVGFGLAGLGVATLIPAAMHAADELPGLRPGTGLTLLSWLLRLGFLVSPPLVGAIADLTALRYGLLIVPVAGVLVVAFSGVLTNHRPADAAPPAHDPAEPSSREQHPAG